MGEFVEIGAGGVSLELISGVFCATALGVYACSSPALQTMTTPTVVAAAD